MFISIFYFCYVCYFVKIMEGEHSNSPIDIYLFLSTKYSILLHEYFRKGISHISSWCVEHPHIPLKYSLAFRFKIFRVPSHDVIRIKHGVAKRYPRFTPRFNGGEFFDAKKYPPWSKRFFKYNLSLPSGYCFRPNGLNHIFMHQASTGLRCPR